MNDILNLRMNISMNEWKHKNCSNGSINGYSCQVVEK